MAKCLWLFPVDSQAALGEERVGLDPSVDSSTRSSGEPRADGGTQLAAILEGQEVAGEGQAPVSLSQSPLAPLALVLSVQCKPGGRGDAMVVCHPTWAGQGQGQD